MAAAAVHQLLPHTLSTIVLAAELDFAIQWQCVVLSVCYKLRAFQQCSGCKYVGAMIHLCSEKLSGMFGIHLLYW